MCVRSWTLLDVASGGSGGTSAEAGEALSIAADPTAASSPLRRLLPAPRTPRHIPHRTRPPNGGPQIGRGVGFGGSGDGSGVGAGGVGSGVGGPGGPGVGSGGWGAGSGRCAL